MVLQGDAKNDLGADVRGGVLVYGSAHHSECNPSSAKCNPSFAEFNVTGGGAGVRVSSPLRTSDESEPATSDAPRMCGRSCG
eukprot:1175768-Prorocentrum_minimum.AAC.1